MRGFFLILIIILSFGCSRNKEAIKLKAVRNKNLVESLTSSQLQYEWFNAKIATELGTEDDLKSFKTVVKIKKDSVIWMSISPLLGIEISRLMITPDSVKFIDKVNNKYFIGDFKTSQERRDLNIEFTTLQEMLVANSILFDPTEKFRSTKGEDSYMITSKTKRKIRKAVGYQKKEDADIYEVDTMSLDIHEKKYKKAVKKNDEEDLVIKRYWLSPDFERIIKSVITYVDTKQIVEAEYKNFEKYDTIYFPEKIKYRLTENEQTLKINLKYNRVRINKPQEFPFSIPDHFTILEQKP